MKDKLFVFFILFPTMLLSQSSTLQEKKANLANELVNQFKKDKTKSNGDGLSYNSKTLNLIFNKEIGNYLIESNNLTTRKSFAVLSNKDGRLFLGGSFGFPFIRKEYSRLSHLITLGVKLDSKDDFSSLLSDTGIEDNISFSFKYSYIGKAVIWYLDGNAKNSHSAAIKYYEDDYLLSEFLNQKIDDYYKKEYELEKALKKVKLKIANGGIIPAGTNLDDYKIPKTKKENIYKELLKEEEKKINKEKWYSLIANWWLSMEVSKSISKTEYNTSTDFTSNVIGMDTYNPFEMNITLGGFLKTSKYGSFQGRLVYKGFQNNSIKADLTDIIKSYSFVEYQNQTDDNDDQEDNSNQFLAQIDESDVYVGEFKRFFTNTLIGEIVYFLPENVFGRDLSFMGFSAAIEKNYGDYDSQNWKLGIPLTFKDKDGKANINFELQWKETNDVKVLGFSLGIPFGKLVN